VSQTRYIGGLCRLLSSRSQASATGGEEMDQKHSDIVAVADPSCLDPAKRCFGVGGGSHTGLKEDGGVVLGASALEMSAALSSGTVSRPVSAVPSGGMPKCLTRPRTTAVAKGPPGTQAASQNTL
jgi:hypothetical protein